MFLSLNGVMVDGFPPEDDEFVKAGIITGCDKLASEIKACNEDLTLKINSYGGSVEGSANLSIALADWCAEHKENKLRVELGAICASAAANLVARLPKQAVILVHPESMLMFHSCSGLVEGSPEILRDNADRMDKINSLVKDALSKRTSLSASVYNQWFEAGREGWLSGLEAVNCGLADGYTEGDYDPMPIIPQNENIENYQYATLAAIATKAQEKIAMEEENKVIETTETTEEVKPEEVAEVETTNEEVETTAEETTETTENTEEVAEGDSKDAEIEALKAENEELKKELEALKATCDKLTSGLKAPSTKVEPKKTFAEMVKEIPTDISEREYSKRFTALKNEHKAEFKAYMDAHKKI